MVSRLDGDIAVESRSAVARAVASASHRLRALVGCIEKCVVPAESEMLNSAAEAYFCSLPARPSEVRVVTEAGLFRCHEQKIVVVLSPEPADVPAQIVFQGASRS